MATGGLLALLTAVTTDVPIVKTPSHRQKFPHAAILSHPLCCTVDRGAAQGVSTPSQFMITVEKGTPVRPSSITPSGVERSFGDDEIIVSKTDPKGILRYANDVFVRVSGYTEEELLGQPHSIIRHPDMPRAVFKLLWDTIASGQEIFAYVNNLAKDGSHYWVFAHVTPSFDSSRRIIGYHSNRRAPEKAAVREVNEIYRLLLNEERRHSNASQAVAASTAMLGDLLHQAGMPYGQWVWSLSPVQPSLDMAASRVGALR